MRAIFPDVIGSLGLPAVRLVTSSQWLCDSYPPVHRGALNFKLSGLILNCRFRWRIWPSEHSYLDTPFFSSPGVITPSWHIPRKVKGKGVGAHRTRFSKVSVAAYGGTIVLSNQWENWTKWSFSPPKRGKAWLPRQSPWCCSNGRPPISYHNHVEEFQAFGELGELGTVSESEPQTLKCLISQFLLAVLVCLESF